MNERRRVEIVPCAEGRHRLGRRVLAEDGERRIARRRLHRQEDQDAADQDGGERGGDADGEVTGQAHETTRRPGHGAAMSFDRLR